MGDSDESWSGGDESNSSEDAASSEPETSDTDEDVKYTTYPTRGVRWRIGESYNVGFGFSKLPCRWCGKTPGMGENQGPQGKAKAVEARRG